MKKSPFILVLILLFTTLHSQNYFPFPTDSAEWGIDFTCQVSFCPSSNLVSPFKIIQKGDTTMNGNLS